MTRETRTLRSGDQAALVHVAPGVHCVHPDKPPEMWVHEVGVAPDHPGRGVGKAVVRALLRHAEGPGCREARTLTDRSNPAAMRLHASAGPLAPPADHAMFTFPLGHRGVP